MIQLVKRISIWVGCTLLLVSCGSKTPGPVVVPKLPTDKPALIVKKSPVRGIWLATVSRLDWPPVSSINCTNAGQRVAEQKYSLQRKLDKLKSLGINTVFFQVKPDASALWSSRILPWSDVLTGTLGEYPGYDPLQFMLDEAHRRGMKVHAWFNPYRVSTNIQPATLSALSRTVSLSPSSVYVQHPEWIRTASDRLVLDPGIPDVRHWVTQVVTEVVANYPLDGVQFDDYFYAESPDSALNDSLTYQRYGQGFNSKADWRRHNTQQLIAEVSKAIKQIKPKVEFGVSPSGVWRNRSSDPAGSDTRGGAAYDESYADTRQWVQKGLLDYIAPQIYWPFSRDAARYDVLTKWWAEVVKPTSTQLYIGVAFYKIGQVSKQEPEWAVDGGVSELKNQLDLNDELSSVHGTILFREDYLNQLQTQKAVNYLKNRWNNRADSNNVFLPERQSVEALRTHF